MGASPEEYTRLAPQHSFLHVDQFKGPKELAEYLLELDRDEDKYNEYFQVPSEFYLPLSPVRSFMNVFFYIELY